MQDMNMKISPLNSKDDLVSVIIPCFNSEKVILNALNSLYIQTYKNIEIIIINDGSKDNTVDVINKYLETRILNVNIISQNNEGVSVARNRGIEAAKGQYIVFLDSDDMYSSDFIFDLTYCINKYNADTAYCFWTNSIEKLEKDVAKEEYILSDIDIMKSLMYNIPKKISFSNFIYKKDIIDKYVVTFPKDIKYGEDNEFLWKYLTHINKGILLNKKMYWYYENPASVMHKISWDNTMALMAVKNIANYLKKNKHPIYDEYCSYLPIRTCWAIAKEFARYNEKKLFDRLVLEENLSVQMKKLNKAQNKLLRISSIIMSINPSFFFIVIRLYYKLK